MLYTITRPADHPGAGALNIALPNRTVRLERGGVAKGVRLDPERDAGLIRDLEKQGYKLSGEGARESKKLAAAAPTGKRPIKSSGENDSPPVTPPEDPGI